MTRAPANLSLSLAEDSSSLRAESVTGVASAATKATREHRRSATVRGLSLDGELRSATGVDLCENQRRVAAAAAVWAGDPNHQRRVAAAAAEYVPSG